VAEVGEGEVLGEQFRVGRDVGRALVAGREVGDDARRGRSDVVDVEFGLGQALDEVADSAIVL
jgi:hypothetical protein